VNVIGHPTGRKIGQRPGYEVDLGALVEGAVATGTALEVNASPRRLDLSGEAVRRAVEGGALLTISCDAHSVGDLASMRYGVATAQRGWARPASVLNCSELDDLVEVVNAKRGPGMRRVRA
jgi:DNA polymerase (family 10)